MYSPSQNARHVRTGPAGRDPESEEANDELALHASHEDARGIRQIQTVPRVGASRLAEPLPAPCCHAVNADDRQEHAMLWIFKLEPRGCATCFLARGCVDVKYIGRRY
jgi:hypothetical protein